MIATNNGRRHGKTTDMLRAVVDAAEQSPAARSPFEREVVIAAATKQHGWSILKRLHGMSPKAAARVRVEALGNVIGRVK